MLRISLSSNTTSRIIRTKALQCFQSTPSFITASTPGSVSANVRTNSIANTRVNSIANTIANNSQCRFKSGSPFPSLRNNTNNNVKRNTNANNQTNSNTNSNATNIGEVEGKKSSPWKHLSIPKAKQNSKNGNKNNHNNANARNNSNGNSNRHKQRPNGNANGNGNSNVEQKFQQLTKRNNNNNNNQRNSNRPTKPNGKSGAASNNATLRKRNVDTNAAAGGTAATTADPTNDPTSDSSTIHPIERLRDTYMQSVQTERNQRRNNNTQKNSNNNNNNNSRNSKTGVSLQNNSESRLDQLLRMSRQKNHNNSNNNNRSSNNANNNNNNPYQNKNASGAKLFHERRKMQQQQQNKNNNNPFQNQQNQFQNSYQNQNNRNQYQNHKREQNKAKHDLHVLQQELLRSNAKSLNIDDDDINYYDPTKYDRNGGGRNQSRNNNKRKGIVEEEKTIILPRKDLTIVELSTILRVDQKKIIRTLKSLGESVPSANYKNKNNKNNRNNRNNRNNIKSNNKNNKTVLLTNNNSTSSDDATPTYSIDVDLAELIALELGLDPQRAKPNSCQLSDAERRILRQNDNDLDEEEEKSMEELPSRPPVVCIMGHVDHGKTTLMDSLRQRALDASSDGMKQSNKKLKKKSKKKKGKKNDDADAGGINKVAGTEAGGITQTVSAFQVALPTTISLTDDDDNGTTTADGAGVDKVTFLDTPGHAAFKAMRQSGSNGADVVVLVIAADDGISPQTIEIIDMYKSIAKAQPGSISLVVALTKIDKPGIDVDESMMRIENQLMEHDIYSEGMTNGSGIEFGGVQVVPVSGITGEGLDDLIEGLVLQSEIMDLRADAEARAEGLVIDAKMEKGLGVVADCIIRWGKLELGDYVVSGTHGGRVRILNDVNNKAIKKANPSQPVRIIGLKSLPKAGDPIVCVQSEEIAKEIISRREALVAKESHRAESSDAPLDVEISGGASKKGFMAQNILRKYGLNDDNINQEEIEIDDTIRIPVILKADADGTLAALRDTLLAIQDESKLNLCIDPISVSIGHVTPSDVGMAVESGAKIFCFNLKGSKDKTAMSLAASEGVEIRSHDVIYHLLDEAKKAFSTYCPPTPIERVYGKATVQAVFDINNNKNAEKVAGLMVQDGYFYLDKSSKDHGSLECHYRVLRGGEIISPDDLRAKSLKRVKEEVTSVRRGEECGLNLKDFYDLQAGDTIECYSVEMQRIFV